MALTTICLMVDAKYANVNIVINESGVSSTSRGLVGDTVFAVLPNIKPIHTFLITIAFQAVSAFNVMTSVVFDFFMHY